MAAVFGVALSIQKVARGKAMAGKGREEKKTRGVFERPVGSGVWWINFYVGGKQRREKVGRKSDAIALYQKRKTEALRDKKLPELRPMKLVTFGELATAAVDYAKRHLATWKDYDWKERTLREQFGQSSAAAVTPEEIDKFLSSYCKTPATANRFRAFFSLCYRLGMENRKVTVNPARLVRARREDNGRLRFLSRAEYDKLLGIIQRDYPEQVPAFIVSIFTGMRWSEQFSLKWAQVDLKRRIIRLLQTKDPTGRVQSRPRNVPINRIALAALEKQRKLVPHKPNYLVFPNAGDYCRFWFEPCVAAVNISGYTWHNNRHTFCSWHAMAGTSIKEIQELSGHKTITMAARYSHLAPDTVASASERIVNG
jgi:integrase